MFLALLFIGFAVGIAALANYVQKREGLFKAFKHRPACKTHSWEPLKVVTLTDSATYTEDPDKIPNQLVCVECGYLPNSGMVLREEYRAMFKEQVRLRNLALERERIVELLKQAFFKHYMEREKYDTFDKAFFIRGVHAYEEFITKLPSMMADYNKQEASNETK